MGFSCYIWNIELILPLLRQLRKVLPGTTIILGGPEVSFDVEYWLTEHEAIDYIIAGEGEEALRRFLEEYAVRGRLGAENLASVPGLAYRTGGGAVVQNPAQPLDLAALPPSTRGTWLISRTKSCISKPPGAVPFAVPTASPR